MPKRARGGGKRKNAPPERSRGGGKRRTPKTQSGKQPSSVVSMRARKPPSRSK